MNDTNRHLAIEACKIIQEGCIGRPSWQFTDDVPEELRAFLDHYLQEWISRDWYTTVQGMIEEQFNISQKEIAGFTEAD